MGSRCQAEWSKEQLMTPDRTYAMWETPTSAATAAAASAWNPQKNGKLNWMMIVAVVQKNHSSKLTGITGSRSDKQPTSCKTVASSHGRSASPNKFHTSAADTDVRDCNKCPFESKTCQDPPATWFPHPPHSLSLFLHISLHSDRLSKTLPYRLPHSANLH